MQEFKSRVGNGYTFLIIIFVVENMYHQRFAKMSSDGKSGILSEHLLFIIILQKTILNSSVWVLSKFSGHAIFQGIIPLAVRHCQCARAIYFVQECWGISKLCHAMRIPMLSNQNIFFTHAINHSMKSKQKH